MDHNFDIKDLNAAFHLRALLPRLNLRCAMGVPEWGWEENKAIFKGIAAHPNGSSDEGVVSKVEKRMTQLFGVKYCLATSSGRDAIKLALLSMGLKPGDKVILPDYTCLSVLTPVLELGLRPVLADIGEDLHLDPESVKRVIRPGTKAIIVPHLFGALAPMDDLLQIAQKNGLRVIDDAAQAIGLKARWGYAGSGGDAGIYSFGPFKPLTATQGGAFLTNDFTLFEYARNLLKRGAQDISPQKGALKSFLKLRLRKYTYLLFLLNRYNQQKNEVSSHVNYSQNMEVRGISTIDAHLVFTQIDKLTHLREKTWPRAKHFYAKLSRIPFLKPCIPWPYNGFPRWVLRVDNSSYPQRYAHFFSYMLSRGIELQPGYRPLHHFIRDWGLPIEGEFQKSELIYNSVVCLPFPDSIDLPYLINCIRQFSALN